LEFDAPPAWRCQTDDRPDRRRLASPIASHQDRDLAADHLQRHALDDVAVAVVRVDLAYREHSWRPSPSVLRPIPCLASNVRRGMSAEVQVLNLGVLAHGTRRAVHDDAPLVKDDHALDELENDLE